MHGRRPEADFGAIILAELRNKIAIGHRDAVELFEEIDVKIGPTELAVSDALETSVLLLLHDLADAFVFNLTKRIGWKLAGEKGVACFCEPMRTEIGADMVGAEGRFRGHVVSSLPIRALTKRSDWLCRLCS